MWDMFWISHTQSLMRCGGFWIWIQSLCGWQAKCKKYSGKSVSIVYFAGFFAWFFHLAWPLLWLAFDGLQTTLTITASEHSNKSFFFFHSFTIKRLNIFHQYLSIYCGWCAISSQYMRRHWSYHCLLLINTANASIHSLIHAYTNRTKRNEIKSQEEEEMLERKQFK